MLWNMPAEAHSSYEAFRSQNIDKHFQKIFNKCDEFQSISDEAAAEAKAFEELEGHGVNLTSPFGT